MAVLVVLVVWALLGEHWWTPLAALVVYPVGKGFDSWLVSRYRLLRLRRAAARGLPLRLPAALRVRRGRNDTGPWSPGRAVLSVDRSSWRRLYRRAEPVQLAQLRLSRFARLKEEPGKTRRQAGGLRLSRPVRCIVVGVDGTKYEMAIEREHLPYAQQLHDPPAVVVAA
jgi:hypothetical protein